jgi:hypothetical protein
VTVRRLELSAMDGRPIGPGDIETLRELTAALGAPFSELCAANLYLFREAHRYRLQGGAAPMIFGVTYDGLEHVTPLTPMSAPEQADLARQAGRGIYPVASGTAALPYNPDDSDYLYRASDLASYAGAARKAPRNLRAQFRRSAAPRDEPFAARHEPDARLILDAWLADVGRPWSQTDYDACREALDLFHPLGLFGVMTYAGDGDPAGFLLASPLADGSAAVHFAKGKRRYPGVFPHLFSRLAEWEGDRYPTLNFEQDLGTPGFRQAKRSHGPIRLLHKHRLTCAAALGTAR